ncbi:tyrosine--tRNA ligase [Candidatus Woesebacteria bacterium RBG_16_36_11]|uniref:Tyrosine--tRNA ligase n=3 Tax=Candidatus Woeseibacteriota TaxID=1752722 RepID=A0A1F7X7N5_9BACT|nr:MAG: tyrosine--tRNA ligase [Candidatus Woesebacteria bacterium RBG_13_36_22]OGM10913.1 MAG: tyrosine--tRNA ligase [Candidatus Woesebacteria bacterium RBG_16_36_11]OGM16883.1 MAG: tyrosine--tRNA ligase [Candidatus Woesebacteria bacterium RBG_19FT_COMBO_37_29]
MANLDIDFVLSRGVENIYPSKEALAALMAKKKIKLYQGFDPSMPNLHLGNFVGLMKLRQFQKLGHEVIFLVGDFTGMIGDPSDKTATRKKLSREDVLNNAKSWKEQAGRVIDFKGNNAAHFEFNSKWNDKISFKELIEITSNFTVQQMLERDMFQERIKENRPIHLHEFFYPVAQAIDCVEMDVDLEIGGSDQIFNMLAGRTLMKATKDKEKFVLATKLLIDSKGEKVGKTTGNALFLNSTPEIFYAGIMSFPDETIKLGFELLTEVDLIGLDEKIKKNPMAEKKRLAFEIVRILWGESKAKDAEGSFKKTFQQKEPSFTKEINNFDTLGQTIAQLEEVGSTSNAKRLIGDGAVKINDATILNPTQKINTGDRIKVGKKIFVIVK